MKYIQIFSVLSRPFFILLTVTIMQGCSSILPNQCTDFPVVSLNVLAVYSHTLGTFLDSPVEHVVFTQDKIVFDGSDEYSVDKIEEPSPYRYKIYSGKYTFVLEKEYKLLEFWSDNKKYLTATLK